MKTPRFLAALALLALAACGPLSSPGYLPAKYEVSDSGITLTSDSAGNWFFFDPAGQPLKPEKDGAAYIVRARNGASYRVTRKADGSPQVSVMRNGDVEKVEDLVPDPPPQTPHLSKDALDP